jgi:ABC-type transporter Mla subunit MlaD
MTPERERATDIRVGLFVTAGLALLIIVIFLIGQERHLFEKPVYLKALFPNVSGLKVGAPVRLAGFDVGIVGEVRLPEPDPNAKAGLFPSTDASTLSEGTKLALSGKTRFGVPANVSASAVDPKNELEVRLRVTGEDSYGRTGSTEDLRLRVRDGQQTITGVKLFAAIEHVEVVSIAGAGPSSTIELGVGGQKKITVVMRISSGVLDRIRHDSEVRVDSMGLLGDKYIDITIGSMEQPQHKDGDTLRSANAVDLNAALADAQRILDNVVVGTDELRKVLSGFAAAGGEEALVAAVRSINDIADEIQNGEGLLHQIVFDPKTGQQYKDLVADVTSSAEKLNRGLADVEAMVKEVRTGDSVLHAAIYGKDGEKVMSTARETLVEAERILQDVRTKKGVIHNLIYDEEQGGGFIANLNDASGDVKVAAADIQTVVADAKAIMADVKAGKGTVGALLADPTVYEDLKVLLGNVRRNDAVKALVRASIAEQDRRAAAPPAKSE